MIRVFVADDHAIIRDGLARLIAETPDMLLAGTAADGRELLDRFHVLNVDVLVVDIHMPHCDGIEVLRQLHQQRPTLPIIIFSMYPEEQYAPRLLRAGAAAYLTKGRATAEVLAAVRKVHKGGRYVQPEVGERLLHDDRTLDEPSSGLTEREHQILRLVAQGGSTSDVATGLGVSPSTVSTHLQSIKRKLGVRTTAELVSYAIRAGVVS